MITLSPDLIANNKSNGLFNVITIIIEEIGKEFSKIAIIAIVFGCIAFITLIIGLVFLIKKKQSDKLKEIRITQRIHNYNPMASMANTQVNLSSLKLKACTKQIKGMIEGIYKEDKLITAYIRKEIKKYPDFILDKSYFNLAYYACSFCEKKFTLNNKLILLDCNHIFHLKCVEQQLITNEKYCCLICAYPILAIPSDKQGTAIGLSSSVLSEKGVLQ